MRSAKDRGSLGSAEDSIWRVRHVPSTTSANGPLRHELVAVKDLFAIRGQTIGAGVRDWESEATAQPTTSPVVGRLVQAGARLAGIAHTDQLAFGIMGKNEDYGTPPNVQSSARMPGGSSSGPGSAVAMGYATIGLGTDTAGSVRVPASYQGIWGIRTTMGSIEMKGVLPLAPSFDTVGWLTRDAKTLRAAANVLLGPPSGQVLGAEFVVWDQVTRIASLGMQRAVGEAGLRLGATSLSERVDIESWFTAYRTVQAAEAWAAHGDWIRAHEKSLAPDVYARFRSGAVIGEHQLLASRILIREAGHHIRHLLGDRVLLLPGAAGIPPRLNAATLSIERERGRTLRINCIASIAGLPAVVSPALRVHGLRAGLCFVGPRHSDIPLVDLADASADQYLQVARRP